jgi:phosphohistidine phosphatase
MLSGPRSRLLAIMRHAKAEQDGPTDFERSLTERGQADAAATGAWLTGAGFEPDHALLSAAVRVRETWSAVADAADWDLDVEVDRGLYAASPDAALDLLRLVDDDVRRLLVIGHNPTMAVLTQLLDDGEGEPDAAAEMLGDFATSAVAVFEHDGSWADLDAGSARLVGYHVGRA